MQTDEKQPVTIVLSEIFLKDITDLAKSYRSVRKDILPLIERLSNGEIVGDRIKGFDYRIYKTRVKNSDNQKGSSGGYRVIYYVQTAEFIVLTNIYSKLDYENIDDSLIEKSIQQYLASDISPA
jgi:mRNA-degrading endonuclease RelE of RelBE toxin-antitoxin system